MVRPGVEQGAALTGPAEDPFHGLEADSEETLAWQHAQNAAADGPLREWEGFEALRDAVAPYLASAAVTAPTRCGQHWLRVEGGVLVVSNQPTGPGPTLVDPGDAMLDWYDPSPRGTRVAYGLSSAGDEQSTLHVVETASGAVRPDRIPFTSNATVAWLPDEDSFAVNAGTSSASTRCSSCTGSGRRRARGRSRSRCVSRTASTPRCPTTAAGSSRYERGRAARRLWASRRCLAPLPAGRRRHLQRCLRGRRYVAVCTEGAPRRRLVRIPVATPRDRGTWDELIPNATSCSASCSGPGETLVVSALRDAGSVLLAGYRRGRVRGGGAAAARARLEDRAARPRAARVRGGRRSGTGLREYGDPRDPDAAAVLRAYSLYHNVRPGWIYPPTLVVAGANDMRCPAWHVRKLVARLQEEAAGGPFVLRVIGGGHLSTRRGADLVAEWQGFVLRHLGIGRGRDGGTGAVGG